VLHTFEHIKLDSLDFEMKQVTKEDGTRRYETPSGQSYPSITTVLSSYNKQGILEWRKRVGEEEANKISSRASRRGTALHKICEEYLNNSMTQFKWMAVMPDTKELFNQVRTPLIENIGKIYCLEKSLYCDTLKIAGQVDCVAEWKGNIAIIDFKTSGKEKKESYIQNYFMQCSGYAEMFEERTGIPVENIVVIIANNETAKVQIFEKKKYDYLDPLKKLIDEHGK
jgi:genome maintenance exonuclease 1